MNFEYKNIRSIKNFELHLDLQTTKANVLRIPMPPDVNGAILLSKLFSEDEEVFVVKKRGKGKWQYIDSRPKKWLTEDVNSWVDVFNDRLLLQTEMLKRFAKHQGFEMAFEHDPMLVIRSDIQEITADEQYPHTPCLNKVAKTWEYDIVILLRKVQKKEVKK